MSKVQYELNCRECGLEWLEDFSPKDIDHFKATHYPSCPECESVDTYIALSAVPTHFKGPGWSPQNYDKFYEMNKSYKKGELEVYDRKEDRARVMAGEHKEAELRKLKHLDRVARKTFGPDAGVTQREAEKKLVEAETKGRKKGLDIHE